MSEQMSSCENCGREFPETKVHSHYAYCRRNIRKCRECGEFIDINEEEEHIQQTHFRQPCRFCNRHFVRTEVPIHEQTCPSKSINCQFCEVPVKLGQLDEHVLVCGSRTKPCTVCNRNVMLLEYEQHSNACQVRQAQSKKEESFNTKNFSSPLVESSYNARQAPPPVPAKYRVERLTENIPVRPTPPKQSVYKPEEDYTHLGFSQEDIETQRALFEHLERQKGSTRQRC